MGSPRLASLVLIVVFACPALAKPKPKKKPPMPDGTRTEVLIKPETLAGVPELVAVGAIGPKSLALPVDPGWRWSSDLSDIYDSMQRAAKIGDKLAIENLIRRDILAEIAEGTPLLIVGRWAGNSDPRYPTYPPFASRGLYKARVQDGPHKGQVVVIYPECVKDER